MALAKWGRYVGEKKYRLLYNTISGQFSVGYGDRLYRSYSFNPVDGTLTFYNSAEVYIGSPLNQFWRAGGSYGYNGIYLRTETPTGGGGQRIDIYKIDKSVSVEEVISQGEYIQNVTAEQGTYPQNGKHTDGYWYVYIGLVIEFMTSVGGVWKNTTSYTNVGGVWRENREIKANIAGIWR